MQTELGRRGTGRTKNAIELAVIAAQSAPDRLVWIVFPSVVAASQAERKFKPADGWPRNIRFDSLNSTDRVRGTRSEFVVDHSVYDQIRAEINNLQTWGIGKHAPTLEAFVNWRDAASSCTGR